MKEILKSFLLEDINIIIARKISKITLTIIKLVLIIIFTFPTIGKAFDKNSGEEIFPNLDKPIMICEREIEGGVFDLIHNRQDQLKQKVVYETEIHVTKDTTSPLLLEQKHNIFTNVRLVINVAARKLKVYKGDTLVKSYPIAVGSSRYWTPLGNRKMSQIVWNPWWIPPKDSAWAYKAKKTPPGPHNPLGPVKMNLGNAILIHGTNTPYSVGSAVSHGCIRMYSEQAKELARFIQEEVTGQKSEELYAKYNRNKRQSYYVKLPVDVPVSIIYKIA